MTDFLTVTYDKNEKESGICVLRNIEGKYKALKIVMGEQAEMIYKILTEQTTEARFAEESEEE